MSSLPATSSFCEKATEGNACLEEFYLPAGLGAVEDQDQLGDAFQPAGMGSMCCGLVVSATAPVTVYRAWSLDAKQFGLWWSPTPPPSSKDEYRWQDDICFAWDPTLSHISTCQLKVGALAAIGPGQSACCKGGNFYPESDVLQMYVPDAEQNVENCETVPWSSFPG